MTSRTEKTQAIVLRRTNYGESDRIMLLMTQLGRRSVIAKGIRKEKSKLAGNIELLSLSDVIICASKNGSLGILTSAKLRTFYGENILNDFDKLDFAYKIIKKIEQSSMDVDVPDWHYILLAVLDSLSKDIPIKLIETWFNIKSSSLLGEELNLVYDVHGNKLIDHKKYDYNITENGFEQTDEGSGVTSDYIKLLRLIKLSDKPDKILRIKGYDSMLDYCLNISRMCCKL